MRIGVSQVRISILAHGMETRGHDAACLSPQYACLDHLLSPSNIDARQLAERQMGHKGGGGRRAGGAGMIHARAGPESSSVRQHL